MPITLGCPSCGKRFRARDESAGKRVKCPYCQSAVSVPSAEESANAGAPTAPLPPPPPAFEPTPVPPPARPAPSRPPAVKSKIPEPSEVASPDDWGAIPGNPKSTAPLPTGPSRPFPSAPPPEPKLEQPPEPHKFPAEPKRGAKPRPKPAAPEPKPKAAAETPDEVLAKKWRSVRRGLFWVQFALLLIMLMGFVELGKVIYTRSVGELPKGEGWIHIDGYVNSPDPNSIPLSKTDEINLAAYVLPGALAGFLLVIGRMFSGGAPRNSGAGGLFTLSGLVTLVALIALPAAIVCDRVPFPDEYKYARGALLLSLPLAEFWFLTAITASGLALKRPKVPRQVGFVAFLVVLIPAFMLFGSDLYAAHVRSAQPNLDWQLYEHIAVAVGWFLLVVAYWRAVGGVRVGARDFIRAVEDKQPA